MSTKIEWTDETWNPIIGCSRVSEGCDNCYAIGQVRRGEALGVPQHVGLTVKPEGGRWDWTGQVRPAGDKVLAKPLHWSKPRRIFVNSLADLFHSDLADDEIAKVFAVMALTPQHTFQVLTKRPKRMADLLSTSRFWGQVAFIMGTMPAKGAMSAIEAWKPSTTGAVALPNVWLGTSIESDRYAWRADHLRRTPAAVRFISAEPLLGPLPSLDLTGIDWLIVGGESGHGARPMHPDWVRDLRDECLDRECPECGSRFSSDFAHDLNPNCTFCTGRHEGTAFFFKQWGEWMPTGQVGMGVARLNEGKELLVGDPDADGCRVVVRKVGKKAAGRVLDGRTWDEMPGGAS